MFSPARHHRQRLLAAQSGEIVEASAAPAELDKSTPVGQEYAALRVLLYDNLRALSEIQSVEARNPKKAEFATAFHNWIEGVLAAGRDGLASQDEILVTTLVWAIDYRDFDYALRLAAHAIHYNLVLPKRYNRTLPCFLAEEIATISLAQQELVGHNHLLGTEVLTSKADMPDQARAKLHKALSKSYQRLAAEFDPAADNARAGGKAAYLAAALENAKRAFTLDSNIGVKKDIERLESQLKKLADENKEPAQ
jgi:hypothetical protein